jgi:hypothetical protein
MNKENEGDVWKERSSDESESCGAWESKAVAGAARGVENTDKCYEARRSESSREPEYRAIKCH